ncbi:MAG: hypothetical protein JNN04_11895 [Cyclobacteriaceae bacterium]|nr:hypothetical protein [Cyclobacteriaceae bacterium]
MKTNWLFLIGTAASACAWAQTSEEKITRELAFEAKTASNTLMTLNINGSVTVEGYAGDKILVEVKKTIRAKTAARLEEGKEEIQLGVTDRADTLILYVTGTCAPFGKQSRKDWHRKFNGWGYQWNKNEGRGCEDRYDYTMDFVIKVPAGTQVVASTVNQGDVEVTGVSGAVVADNVNGAIRCAGISGATRAATVNGDVNLDFSGNPSGDSRFYTLNGDITANFRKGLAAQLAFKSFNGELYSSVEEITALPVQLEITDRGGEGTRYRVNGNRYKIRQGGPLLDFETFNGDVIVREK